MSYFTFTFNTKFSQYILHKSTSQFGPAACDQWPHVPSDDHIGEGRYTEPAKGVGVLMGCCGSSLLFSQWDRKQVHLATGSKNWTGSAGGLRREEKVWNSHVGWSKVLELVQHWWPTEVSGAGSGWGWQSHVCFSSGTLCSAETGAGTCIGWTKLEWTQGKLILRRQILIYQPNKKCHNFSIGILTFSLSDLGFMHVGWGGSMSCVARVCGKSLKSTVPFFLPATELLSRNSRSKLSKLSLELLNGAVHAPSPSFEVSKLFTKVYYYCMVCIWYVLVKTKWVCWADSIFVGG